MSPEMLNFNISTPAMDLWSLGLIIYEMLVGRSPFANVGNFAVYETILKGKFSIPSELNTDAKDIIEVLFIFIELFY